MTTAEWSMSQLARAGFSDLDLARRLLSSASIELLLETDHDHDLLADLSHAADPDQALLLLTRFLEACSSKLHSRIIATMTAEPDVCRRLIDVVGMSEALGDFLVRHPEQWQVLADGERIAEAPGARAVREHLLRVVGADPHLPDPVAASDDITALDALRIAYREHLLAIAARDLAGLAPMGVVASWLSDLADGVLEAALAIARAGLPENSVPCRIAVIGMGKCGGRELNYVSDVDVIFVAEPWNDTEEEGALRTATLLATGLMRACNLATSEGTIWEVDPNLRPEGKQGTLVRTLRSHVGYYERWAKTWEFQALLKARYCAGDRELGERYVDAIAPFVWSAADRAGFVEDVQAMRRRVEQQIPARVAEL